jgi:hypothetical protein
MADKDQKTIVEIAHDRYQRAHDAYNSLRQQAIADTRFVMGDSENQWQWPEDVYQQRAATLGKPCLTINLTAQHCNQVINAIRQNRPAGRVLPVDSMADPDTAEILGGLCRSIQSYSNADTAHDIAAEHAIYGGEGYWRILTEYESEESFDQVITIKSLTNPQLVYIDPDAVEPDRSDAKWGFIFEDISIEQAKEDHPDLDPSSWATDGDRGWVKNDTIRRAEYFWCEYKEDTLYLLGDGSTALKSKLPQGAKVAANMLSLGDGQVIAVVKERQTKLKQWYWCKLLGGETEPVDKREWMGKYLPIVTVVGKELNVNGDIVRKGIVRDLKDPARMVNYSYSASVETLALQNKVPYLAAAESIENFEDIWGAANIDNRAYLPWNAFNEEGQPLPKPERQQPAMMAAAQVQMLQLSTEEMRAASGQQNANFGIKSEANSGIGIQRLKAQGEIATFHFPDNLARALTYEMRVLVDLIPKIYDSKRIVRILGLDGGEEKAHLDPDMQQPYAETPSDELGEVNKIFNPLMGRYDVAIDTGPSYHTQRQEAAEALTNLTQHNPQIMQVAGDIVMRAYDFPMAEEMAKRLEKTLPPGLKEENGAQPPLPPEVQQHMQQSEQQIQQLDHVIQQMQAEIQKQEEDAGAAKLAAQKAQAESIALKLELQKRDALEQIEEAKDQGGSGADMEYTKQAALDARERDKQEQQDARERYKIDQQMQLEREKAELVSATAIEVARISHTPAVPDAATAGNETMGIVQQLLSNHQELMAQVVKPKQAQIHIVKQADGSFVGKKVEG